MLKRHLSGAGSLFSRTYGRRRKALNLRNVRCELDEDRDDKVVGRENESVFTVAIYYAYTVTTNALLRACTRSATIII